MSASPSLQQVVQGGRTKYTVTVAPTAGATGTVNLAVSGLPGGVTASLGANPLNVSMITSTTLTVATSPTTTKGNYTLTITGVGASVTHSTTVTLLVKRK